MTNARMRDLRVVVTAVGAPGAVNIVDALRKNGERKVTVLGTDIRPDPSGKAFVDSYRIVPRGSSPNYVKRIISVCREFKADALLPLSTEELVSLATNKKAIESRTGTKVSISKEKSIRTALMKAPMYRKLAPEGVPVPEFRIVRSLDEFRRACRDLGYPGRSVCMKPSFAHGGRGFRHIASLENTTEMLLESKPEGSSISFEEAERVLKGVREFPELIVMEYLPGKEYSVDLLCSKGVPRVAIPRLRTEVRSGISFNAVSENNREAIRISRQICRKVEFDGPIGIQLKEDRNQKLKLLEINPRLHGSVILSVAAGVNIPYLALKECLGEKYVVPKPRYGTKMTRYWGASFHGQDGLSYTF